jgi:hypothetical protein
MVGQRFHVCGSGSRCAVNQLAGSVEEDLDSGGRQPSVNRAWLCLSAGNCFVQEERRSVDVQSRHTAQIP